MLLKTWDSAGVQFEGFEGEGHTGNKDMAKPPSTFCLHSAFKDETGACVCVYVCACVCVCMRVCVCVCAWEGHMGRKCVGKWANPPSTFCLNILYSRTRLVCMCKFAHVCVCLMCACVKSIREVRVGRYGRFDIFSFVSTERSRIALVCVCMFVCVYVCVCVYV